MLVLLAILFLVVAITFCAAHRARARMEFRAELLDLLAGACRGGVALPPLLSAASKEHTRERGALLDTMSMALADGEALSDVLARAPDDLVPGRIVGAVRAAEGTSTLPDALESAAADTGEMLGLRHRLFLTALYPLLLALLVIVLHAACVRLLWRGWSGIRLTGVLSSGGFFLPAAVGIVLGGLVSILGYRVLKRVGWIPGGRPLALARLLETASLLVTAGLPLHEAFSRATDGAAAPRRLATRVRADLAALTAGAPTTTLWRGMGLSATARARLGLARPERLGAVLADASRSCLDAWRRRSERLIRWMAPISVLLIGAIVLIDFGIVMDFLANARDTGGPPLW